MRTQHQTIALTVLGADPLLTDGVCRDGCAGALEGAGGQALRTRRALLVIRPDDDAHGLRRRLRDSITRLAGGAAADAGHLAGQIIDDLRRASRTGVAHRGWTLAHIWESPHKDPYAPRLSRLRLIDTPIRRWRAAQSLRRSSRRTYEQLTHRSKALYPSSLS